jgi:hypothetical protein
MLTLVLIIAVVVAVHWQQHSDYWRQLGSSLLFVIVIVCRHCCSLLLLFMVVRIHCGWLLVLYLDPRHNIFKY